ncbi:MAG: accessory regulator AgrB [Dehalobacter sp. 4CP]|uniref:accessory gene regulator ArgB-like protein n=1 Tax=Dehalobacter sp. CP TaxID=2594474 RepID=UPI0013C880F7|nr:accessory gene regulator B family protein [Dehalobacter sp.]NBJ14460.1 accessory regulator AgrB [Dehalobacter sp. 4CP]
MDLSQISERISRNMTAELDFDNDKKEIVAYGIESLVLTVLGFLAIMGMAFLFKALVPTVIAAVFGGFLRRVSGGAHFDTPLKCLAFGAVVYSSLGVIAKEIVNYGFQSSGVLLAVLLFSLALVAILAPVDCEAKPIHSQNFRRKLKIISIGFVILTIGVVLVSNNFLVNTSAVLGIVFQTMTLLPVFNKKRGITT